MGARVNLFATQRFPWYPTPSLDRCAQPLALCKQICGKRHERAELGVRIIGQTFARSGVPGFNKKPTGSCKIPWLSCSFFFAPNFLPTEVVPTLARSCAMRGLAVSARPRPAV